jgi:hypothetical protein
MQCFAPKPLASSAESYLQRSGWTLLQNQEQRPDGGDRRRQRRLLRQDLPEGGGHVDSWNRFHEPPFPAENFAGKFTVSNRGQNAIQIRVARFFLSHDTKNRKKCTE